MRDVTSRIDHGELGGLLDLRDNTIGGLINEANELALSFAEAVNAQHRAGLGKYLAIIPRQMSTEKKNTLLEPSFLIIYVNSFKVSI
jgi:flagellar hook-associated protein FlgK